jgi:hypothetical protein
MYCVLLLVLVLVLALLLLLLLHDIFCPATLLLLLLLRHVVCCCLMHVLPQYLSLQLPLCALQVFDEQVLARELVMVWEVVDALPIMQMDLIQLMMDPAACHHNQQ